MSSPPTVPSGFWQPRMPAPTPDQYQGFAHELLPHHQPDRSAVPVTHCSCGLAVTDCVIGQAARKHQLWPPPMERQPDVVPFRSERRCDCCGREPWLRVRFFDRGDPGWVQLGKDRWRCPGCVDKHGQGPVEACKRTGGARTQAVNRAEQ